MATWVNEVTTKSGGNVSLVISGGYGSVSRSGSSFSFNYGVRFKMSSTTWTSNSIAAFVGGTRYYAFDSGSGARHTAAGTWYYANGSETPFGYSGTAGGTGSGSVSISVGTGWNAWTPSNQYTYSFSVPYPAAATYKVSYNANQGSGAPGEQTKYQGYTLTLSSTKPTRTGYEFQGWATSSGGSVAYSPGSSYTSNSGVTLYAVWKALNPVFSAPSLSKTETTISWNSFTSNIKSNFYYRVNGGSWVSLSSATTTAAAKTLTGLNPNTSYTIDFRADNADSTSLQTTHSSSTTTYNWPYITALGTSNITAGGNQIFTLYNPLSRNVTITISSVNGTAGTYASTTSSSTSASLTVPTSVTSKFTSVTSAPIVYTCTYSSQSKTISGTVNITAAMGAPTINADKKSSFFNYLDCATFTMNGTSFTMDKYTGSNKKFLRGYSKLQYNLVSANNPFTPQYSASISSYKVQINSKTETATTIGTTYYEGSSGGTPTAASAVTIANQNYTITISATDSRGFTSSYTISLITYPYSKPVVSISSGERAGGYGTSVTASISGTWCPSMQGVHTAQKITLYYKTTSASSYSTKDLYTDSGSASSYKALAGSYLISGVAFDSNSAYNLYIRATDGLGQYTESAIYVLSPGIPIMMIDAEQTGVGINTLPRGKGLYYSDFLNTISLTGGDGNTAGYRLIAQQTLGAWSNNRVVFSISSRHTGNGIVIISFGCNASEVTAARVYCEIVYIGNDQGGSQWTKDMFQAYLSEDGTQISFFWKYNDYNTTNIAVFTKSGNFNLQNGAWMTSIGSIYGTLKAQTKRCSPCITYGTENPSGGDNGDIYIKYS